jgi:rhodanese-related sulfurtransferase
MVMRLWAWVVPMLLVTGPLRAAVEEKPAVPEARITQDELKKLLEKDTVLVVDVRSADAYKSAHIPGAVSIPLAEIEAHAEKLKSEKKAIVTYCS